MKVDPGLGFCILKSEIARNLSKTSRKTHKTTT